MSKALIGIFVGGAGARMGHVSKGLLHAPDGQTLVARLLGVCREACPDAELCLVGASDAYGELAVRSLPDDPPDSGPIGGLRALLCDARSRHAPVALAIACDLPFLSVEFVRELAEPPAAALAWVPKIGAHFQPLAAAYHPEPCLAALEAALARGKRSLMSVLDQLGPGVIQRPLEPSDERTLRDWDTPEDMAQS